MTPEQVAASYDQIADMFLDLSTYGFAQIERAVAFVKNKAVALDVGCGTGRMMGLLGKHGFRTDGIDSSAAMIALVRDRHPEARLSHADIGRWDLPRSYDLIVAWDSEWHVPLAQQEAVLTDGGTVPALSLAPMAVLPEAWPRTAVHGQSGPLTLRQPVLQAVRHLRHHLPLIAEERAALGTGGPSA